MIEIWPADGRKPSIPVELASTKNEMALKMTLTCLHLHEPSLHLAFLIHQLSYCIDTFIFCLL